MATFPAVGDLERDDALARLERRHRQYEDSRWSEVGDEPRAVLDYLADHRPRLARLPRELAQGDVWDELVLAAWVHWDDRRREATALHHAIRRGLSLREVGRFVGVHTAQGMRDYLDSLDARLHEYRRLTREHRGDAGSPAPGGPALLTEPPENPDATQVDSNEGRARRSRNPYLRHQGRSRAVRGADGQFMRDRRATENARPARERWLAAHHDRVHAVLGELLEQTERLGLTAEPEPDCGSEAGARRDLGDYLAWIRDDLDDATTEGVGVVDDATLGALGLALRALRADPTVVEKPRHHGIHRTIGAADVLRSDYAALTPATDRLQSAL